MQFRNRKVLLKVLFIFIGYFCYTNIVTFILNNLGLNDQIANLFIADIIFSFGIVFIYKDYLKKCFIDFNKKYNLKQKIWFIIKWVGILFIINILFGAIIQLDARNDNTSTIYDLASISTIYTIFKTMIFGCIIEELVFKKAIREIINNNYIFIIVSGFLYSLISISVFEFNLVNIVDFIKCFILFSILSYVFIKNDDNIFSVILIKFCYNILPLVMMLTSIGA